MIEIILGVTIVIILVLAYVIYNSETFAKRRLDKAVEDYKRETGQ